MFWLALGRQIAEADKIVADLARDRAFDPQILKRCRVFKPQVVGIGADAEFGRQIESPHPTPTSHRPGLLKFDCPALLKSADC